MTYFYDDDELRFSFCWCDIYVEELPMIILHTNFHQENKGTMFASKVPAARSGLVGSVGGAWCGGGGGLVCNLRLLAWLRWAIASGLQLHKKLSSTVCSHDDCQHSSRCYRSSNMSTVCLCLRTNVHRSENSTSKWNAVCN